MTRVAVSALLFPSVATAFGQVVFKRQGNLRRAIYGGAALIVIKGIINMYYKDQQYKRQVSVGQNVFKV
jgi:hypothetical protein